MQGLTLPLTLLPLPRTFSFVIPPEASVLQAPVQIATASVCANALPAWLQTETPVLPSWEVRPA